MKDQKNGGVNPITAAVAGAVVGAGIAVAGVVLSDEKNRKKVKDVATGVKDKAVDYIQLTQKQANAKKNELEKRITDDKRKLKKVVNSAKNSLDKTTKEVNNAVKSL
jgi:gas vesicle protein